MYVWIAILLLVCTLVFSFTESFVPTNVRRIIQLDEDALIVRIEIECREPTSKAFLQLAEIELIDESDKPINYWTYPNSIHFEKGDDGFQGKTNPLEHVYDGDIRTYANSKVGPDKLTILLKSAVGKPIPKITSIQITHPNEGKELIQKYDMNLYSQDKRIGSSSLTELREKGSILYVLMRPTTPPKREKDIPVDQETIDDILANRPVWDISGSILSYTDVDYQTDFVGTIPGGPDGTYRLKQKRT